MFANLVEVLAEAEADSDVDPDDPEAGMDAFGEAMALMFDPEVLAAAATLEEYLVDECGLDPDQAEEMFGTGGLDGANGEAEVSIPEGDDQFPDGGSGGDDFGAGDAEDPSDISLDDMDDVQEANSGSSWAQKNYSTTISNDQYIVIATTVGTDGFSEDEALEACDAIRAAFEDRQPDLEVEVRSGETVMATGVAGEPCHAA